MTVPGAPRTTLVHVSDVHFGAEVPARVAGLLERLAALAPDLVVVSGDLTQRARERQFRAARRFLDDLPAPYLVVPGNHEIPLFDLARRVLAPRARYLRHITDDLTPLAVVGDVRVLGLDSTRRRTAGMLTPERLTALGRLAEGDPDDLRVLVTHHPLVDRHVEGFGPALAAAAQAGVDLLLAGHVHLSGRRRVRHDPGLGILQVQAGTATSHRLRAKERVNSFNVLRWDGAVLQIDLETWRQDRFEPEEPRRFGRGADGWREAAGAPFPAAD